MKTKLFSALLIMALVLASVAAVAFAAPAVDQEPYQAGRGDDLSHPLGEQQRALKQQAMEAKLHGKAYGRTHEVARGQFVELERVGEDSIWTVLAEFGDAEHPGQILDATRAGYEAVQSVNGTGASPA